uniref:Fatty acid hydroxylase domain-containing protein n=1 Tax=Coccolithus braarudii TaxID=221442 RepID=A0A7S0LJB0_9EUKA
MALIGAAADVLMNRGLPLVIARALQPADWGVCELLVLGLLTQIGLELYRSGVPKAFASWAHLPARGKPLEKLALRDRQFIVCSQLAVVVMTFHYLQFMASSPNVLWHREELSLANTCLALPLFFVVYDFFYAPFHRALHHRLIYAYVHKHHHRQVVPTRGNTDAINVHPFEFISGEYNHLLTIYLVSKFVMPIHALSCIAFLLVGGCLATLNHTRLDFAFVHLPFTRVPIFGVRAHDTHHVIPNSNYGQYIMLWDYVMGTFRPHPMDADENATQAEAEHLAGGDGHPTESELSAPAEVQPGKQKCA